MTIVYKKGDVLNSGEEVVVHGCNCFNTMGSGVARQVKEQFPQAYNADQQTLRGDETKLGNFTYGRKLRVDGSETIVVNAYTQYRYTFIDVDVDYRALETAFVNICERFPNEVIAMPKIGCGLAGGDWEVVSKILEKVSEKYGRTFVVYELEHASVV